MYCLDPIPMTDATVIASSLPETDHALWSNATAYTTGQRVRRPNHRIYEASGAIGPVATAPEDDPDHWIDVSATNKWQPFDYYLADQAVGSDISYTIEPGVAADRLLLFNMRCDSVSVTVENGATTLMDETFVMQETPTAVDFFTWIMAVPEPLEERSIPLVYLPGATITVVFNGADVAIGQIVIGRPEAWGITTWNTSLGLRDFSSIKLDDFGVRKVTKRNASYDINFQVVVPPEMVPLIKKRVKAARGTVRAFLGTLDAIHGSMVLGVMTKMSLDYSNPGLSNYTLTAEGIT